MSVDAVLRLSIIVRKGSMLPALLIFTHLNPKASQLKVGMKLRAVKALLGEPQWASIVVDEGRLAIRERNMEFVLRWRNRPCVPVRVTFRRGLKITGWDDGRLWWYRS